jgi:hypothetical protein
MHISLLLYCVGLILFVFSIDRKLVPLSIFYIVCAIFLYTTVTVLQFFFLDCPYVTPFTAPSWRLYHFLLLGIFSTIRVITHLLHVLLTLGPQTSRPVSWSHRWRITLKKQVDKHRKRLSDGQQRSIELHAMESTAPERSPTDFIDNYSDKEAKDFAAWVPEFFETYAQSGAKGTIPLMSDQSRTKTVFGFRLHHLLKIYIQGTSTLPEKQRRRRLRVCLECLWCWAKACRQDSASLPSYFPLPNPDMIRRLQAEQDPTAAIIARCLSALVAEKLAADVTTQHSSDVRDHDTKLEALSAILGRTHTELETFLSQPGAIGLANIVSLTSSVLKTLFFTEVIPSTEVLGIFRTTVDILLADDSMTLLNADLPQNQNLVSSLRKTHSNSEQSQAPDWLGRQLWPILEKLDARPARVISS